MLFANETKRPDKPKDSAKSLWLISQIKAGKNPFRPGEAQKWEAKQKFREDERQTDLFIEAEKAKQESLF